MNCASRDKVMSKCKPCHDKPIVLSKIQVTGKHEKNIKWHQERFENQFGLLQV